MKAIFKIVKYVLLIVFILFPLFTTCTNPSKNEYVPAKIKNTRNATDDTSIQSQTYYSTSQDMGKKGNNMGSEDSSANKKKRGS